MKLKRTKSMLTIEKLTFFAVFAEVWLNTDMQIIQNYGGSKFRVAIKACVNLPASLIKS